MIEFESAATVGLRKAAMLSHFSVHVVQPHTAVPWSTCRETLAKGPPSVLKGDDTVHLVDVIRAVPENPREVVRVRGVVQLYLPAEASILGERVNLLSVVNDLNRRAG